MGKILSSLLVGMHFRPPAKQVVAALPGGTVLTLQPEPENPYDPHALQVLCSPRDCVPEGQYGALSEALDGTGQTLEELLEVPEFHLGYVAATGGKPLAKVGLTAGNQQFLEFMAAHQQYTASLSFAPDGAPMVLLTVLSEDTNEQT